MTQILVFVLGRVENIGKKGEDVGYQHFLLFPQSFQKVSFPKVLKVMIVWQRVNLLPDHKILDWCKLKQIADDIFNYF